MNKLFRRDGSLEALVATNTRRIDDQASFDVYLDYSAFGIENVNVLSVPVQDFISNCHG